jgi:hypothetical protein
MDLCHKGVYLRSTPLNFEALSFLKKSNRASYKKSDYKNKKEDRKIRKNIYYNIHLKI